MSSPPDRKYSESHEWFRKEGDMVTVGLTRFAVDELTDVTYIEMKPIGTRINPGESVGEVESVKTSSDVFAAIGGEIVEVNPAVGTDPALLNHDPYGEGWLIRIRTNDASPLDALMDHATYDRTHSVG